MNEKHIHSWRRFKKDVFLCDTPTCYLRLTSAELEGKLTMCRECGESFVFCPKNIPDSATVVRCNNCSGLPEPELTVERQAMILRTLVMDKFRREMEKDYNLLKARETILNKQEHDLNQLSYQLGIERENIKVKQLRLAKQREELATLYRMKVVKLRQEKALVGTPKPSKIKKKEVEQAENAVLDALKDLIQENK